MKQFDKIDTFASALTAAQHQPLHYAIRADIFGRGGFVTDKTGLKIFVFINTTIFAFTTFVTNTTLWGKVSKNIVKIFHLIFWMLQRAKYLLMLNYMYDLICQSPYR